MHDREAEVYDLIHSEIFNYCEQKRTNEDIKCILKKISLHNPAVLDIGCGTGNLSLKFLKHGCIVVGLDISQKMLEALGRKTASDLLQLVNSDVDEFLLKSEKRYDIICLSSVLHHLPDFMMSLKNAMALVNDGGIIYITHEPLPKSFSSTFFSILHSLDEFLFLVYLKLRAIKIPPVDYTYSDYHIEVKGGINPDLIIDYFKKSGFEIMHFEKYNVCKFSIFSYMNKLNKTKRLFKIIARKKGKYIEII